MVVVPDDELYDKVVILKPEAFLPENIAQGVIIAGIEGTFEGAKDMPTLNAPSILRSGDTITITNPSTNGNFNKGFNIYSGEDVAFYQTGTTFSLIGKFAAEQNYIIQATCDLSLASPILTRILNGHKTYVSSEDCLNRINKECLSFFDWCLKDKEIYYLYSLC